MSPLSQRLLAALGAEAGSLGDGLDAQLELWLVQGRTNWPSVELTPEAFVDHLAAQLAPGDELAAVRGADLYLAGACLHRDAPALRVVTEMIRAESAWAARRTGPAIDAEELASGLLEQLLVGEAQEGPRVGQYAGRGDLRAWVRVSALRAALKRSRAQPPSETLDDEILEGLVGSTPSPELHTLKRLSHGAFARGFREALGRLTPRERNLLRQHYLDGLTLDRLASLYRVHRMTALRWLEGARQAVLGGVRDALAQELGLGRLEVDSLVRLIRSGLEVSLTVLLAEQAAPQGAAVDPRA